MRCALFAGLPGLRRAIVHGRIVPALDSALVTHPTLGLPPTDVRAGFPDAAADLRRNRARLAARALEVAVDRDPTLRERFDEVGLRELLADAEVELERIARAVATGSPRFVAEWAEWVAPLYRRRRVPMDDLVNVSEALRSTVRAILGPDETPVADRAIDEAVRVFRWHRRLAGDARKRNRLLQLIYKGA